MEIGSRIKEWRHALGVTQDEFARRAGLSKATLVGYEVGQRKPGAEALAAIAKTGVNMTWLLTGEGEMLPAREPETRAERGFERDLTDLADLAGPHARRWAKIIELVESSPEDAEALLDEIYARARAKTELAELRRAVNALAAEVKKSA